MRKLLGTLLLLCSLAPAGTIASYLPDYDGPAYQSGFPIDLGIIGTFNYLIPAGVTITGATIGGTYGTSSHPGSTAGFDVTIAGFMLVACVPGDAGCYLAGTPLRTFSLTIPVSSLAGLLAGSVDLRIIQIGDVVVRYGTPELTIHYRDGLGLNGQAPEPATWLLNAIGVAVTIALRRRAAH